MKVNAGIVLMLWVSAVSLSACDAKVAGDEKLMKSQIEALEQAKQVEDLINQTVQKQQEQIDKNQ